MSKPADPKITISASGTAFQKMCNFVAIAETRGPDESLRELILHTLLTFDNEKASSVQDVADILRTMFGVDAPNHDVQRALDQLMSAGQLQKPLGTNYVLAYDARTKIKARIEQASQLQNQVRLQWQAEMVRRFPDLNADHAWAALEDYLARAFLRHGIQVAAFLDPSVKLPPEYMVSLSSLLTEAVNSKFDPSHQTSAQNAIFGFLATAGNIPERAKFIAECADGAFNYFSLAVSPEVSARFREKLNPLTLFCDTNFLFGVLDLHVHPLMEVSNYLLGAIAGHKLPFKLRYHEATLRELQSSISHYADILRRHRWSQSLSRAATNSRYMSGIELKYHQRNAETGISVDLFLRPYQHVDVLLNERGIAIYKSSAARLTERATLQVEYEEFLKRLRKEKLPELIDHDVTILDRVRSLRNTAESTLEAGALLVTCDYTLYRFDSEQSRKANTYASVVLPNVMWQILRPFIPASQDFDRSFAETFAIPEFRTIGSGAAKACSKMLGLLAAYKDFPEETAARLLSNDMLIDRLRAAENDEQFKAQVESAIALENQGLLEERATMERQIESLKDDKESVQQELERLKQEAATEAIKAQGLLKEKKKEADELVASKGDAEAQAKEMREKVSAIEAARILAENVARQEADRRREAEKQALHTAKVASIIVALLVSLIFEVVIHSIWRWDWLLRHPNSYGLQGSLCLMASFGIVGLWVRPWRRALWGVGLFGVLFGALQILGGPAKNP